MFISDPPLAFDMSRIGEKVVFNSTRQESIDGFIKNKQECVVILPPVLKMGGSGEVLIKENVLPLDYEFPE
jgi:hypothetical protein